MELKDMRRGATYEHKTWGQVILVASHPYDGAGLIVERDVDDFDGDEYKLCEASDLLREVAPPMYPSPIWLDPDALRFRIMVAAMNKVYYQHESTAAIEIEARMNALAPRDGEADINALRETLDGLVADNLIEVPQC